MFVRRRVREERPRFLGEAAAVSVGFLFADGGVG